MKEYFHDFPGVERYLDEIGLISFTQRLCGNRCLAGNASFLTSKAGRIPALRAREEREAINAPIQGTAANIIRIAMIRLPPLYPEAGLKTRILLLQVHDELVWKLSDSELREAAKVVQETMEGAMILEHPLSLRMPVGVKIGAVLKSISELQ